MSDPDPADDDSRLFDRLALLWGVMLTLCVTGYTFGQSNHHVYLLDALRFGHPELLARDWFTTHTLQYHFLFTLLTVGLQKVGLLTAGFFTLYLGLVVALHVAWRSIVRSIGGDWRVYAFSVLIYHLSAGGLGLGVYQFLQDGSFLPSNVAAVATLAALAFWLRGMPGSPVGQTFPFHRTAALGTSICVGIAGLFHVNYAMGLIGAWTGLSLLAAVQARSWRGLIAPRALLLTAVAMTPCLCNVAVAALAARDQRAAIPIDAFVAVYVRLRHSHHHEPLAWPPALWISFLWPMPFALFALARMPASRVRAGVAVVFCAVLGVLAFAFTFAGVWYVSETIVKLSLFRFSPFAKLLSCVLTAWLVLTQWRRGRTAVGLLAAAFTLGLPAILVVFRDRWPTAIPLPSVGLIAGVGIGSFWLAVAMLDRRVIVRRQRVLLAASLLLALPVCLTFAAQQRLGVAMPGEGDAEMAELCRWAQRATPVDALFLVPPHDQSFTLDARRAEVVGFKHVPQLSAELVEWKRRLDDVLDMDVVTLPTPMPRTMAAMAEQYAALSPAHLQAVAARYDCDYLIAMRSLDETAPLARLVHVTPGGRYFVYARR